LRQAAVGADLVQQLLAREHPRPHAHSARFVARDLVDEGRHTDSSCARSMAYTSSTTTLPEKPALVSSMCSAREWATATQLCAEGPTASGASRPPRERRGVEPAAAELWAITTLIRNHEAVEDAILNDVFGEAAE
jgi:hypothetical protein